MLAENKIAGGASLTARNAINYGLLFEKGKQMRSLRFFAVPVILAAAGVNATRAGDSKVLVAGPPPLTQDTVDDYAKFAEWRWGLTPARVGGSDRFRQMVINTWTNGDKDQMQVVLATVKWWRDEYPKLNAADRDRLAANRSAEGLAAERAALASANEDAIRRLQLNQWFDARQREILGVSAAAAKGHETNMRIIDTYRGRGRYEYNPMTGRYDRYVR